jgi:hypothetical protein
MSREAYNRIREGLDEALAWSRNEIALPVTDYSAGVPITTVRHRGAPAKTADRDAPQAEEAQKRQGRMPSVQTP